MVLQHALLTPTNASHGHVFLKGGHKPFLAALLGVTTMVYFMAIYWGVAAESEVGNNRESAACNYVSTAWGVINASPKQQNGSQRVCIHLALLPKHYLSSWCVWLVNTAKSNHCGNISWVIAVIKHTPTALDDEMMNWNVSGVLKRSQKLGPIE